MFDYLPINALGNNLLKSSRRKFLRQSGSLAALGALSATLPATLPAKRHGAARAGKRGIDVAVLFRWEDKPSTAFAKILNQYGARATALRDDPIRQWRDGLGATFSNSDKSRSPAMVGLTNWSDFLIMRELAAEVRKFPLVEVQLGGNQYNRPNVLAQYAKQLVSVAGNPGNRALQNKANRLSSTDKHSRSLFAWVIA